MRCIFFFFALPFHFLILTMVITVSCALTKVSHAMAASQYEELQASHAYLAQEHNSLHESLLACQVSSYTPSCCIFFFFWCRRDFFFNIVMQRGTSVSNPWTTEWDTAENASCRCSRIGRASEIGSVAAFGTEIFLCMRQCSISRNKCLGSAVSAGRSPSSAVVSKKSAWAGLSGSVASFSCQFLNF